MSEQIVPDSDARHNTPQGQRITLGINRTHRGKLPDDTSAYAWARYNDAFIPATVTLDELAALVAEQGYAFAPVVKGRRKEANFISAQHIGLDFDTGTDACRLDTLASDPFIARYAALLYTSPSHTEQKPRARVVFLLDRAITDAAQYRRYVTALIQQYALVDKKAKDPARLFFGAPHADTRLLRNVLPVAVLDRITPAPAPEPVTRPAAATAPQGDGSKWLEEYCAKAQDGTRNATGFDLACQLRDDGIPASAAEQLMLAYQRATEHLGAQPYTEAEARASLRSAYKTAPRNRAEARGRGAGNKNEGHSVRSFSDDTAAPEPEPPAIDDDTAPAELTRFPHGVPYTMHKRIMNAHYQTGVQSQHPAGLFYHLWHELAGKLENGFTLPQFEAATQEIGRNATRYTLETGALQAEAWGIGELCEKCNHTYCGTEVSMVAKFAKLPGRPATRIFRFFPADVALRNFMARFERLAYEHAYRDAPADVRPDYAEPDLEPEAVTALNALRAPVYAQHALGRADAWSEYERVVGFLTADAGPIERDTYKAVTLPPGPTPNAAAFRRLLQRALVPEEGEREEAWRDRYEVGVSRSTLARIRADNGIVTVPRFVRMKQELVTRGQILGAHADGTVTVQLPSAEKFPATEEEQRAAEQQSERQRRNRTQRDPKVKPEPRPDPLVIPRTYTEAHLLRQFTYTPGHEDVPRYDADGEVYAAAQRWRLLAEYVTAPPAPRERVQLAAIIAAAGQADGQAFLAHSEPRERDDGQQTEAKTSNAEAAATHAPAHRAAVSASAAGPTAAPGGSEHRTGGIGSGVVGLFSHPVSGQPVGACEICGAVGRQDMRGGYFCDTHYTLPPVEKDRRRAERGHA